MMRKRPGQMERSDSPSGVLPGAHAHVKHSSTSSTRFAIYSGVAIVVFIVLMLLWPSSSSGNNSAPSEATPEKAETPVVPKADERQPEQQKVVPNKGEEERHVAQEQPEKKKLPAENHIVETPQPAEDEPTSAPAGGDGGEVAPVETEATQQTQKDEDEQLTDAHRCIVKRLQSKKHFTKMAPKTVMLPQHPSYFAIRRMENIDTMLASVEDRDRLVAEIDGAKPKDDSQFVEVPHDRFMLDLSGCDLAMLLDTNAEFLTQVFHPMLVKALPEKFNKVRVGTVGKADSDQQRLNLLTTFVEKELVGLDLGNNNLVGLPDNFDAMFPSLEILFLSSNEFVSVPGAISRMMSLTRLSLKSNKIEGVDPVKNFPPYIEHLILTENRISSFESSFCDVIENSMEQRLQDAAKKVGAGSNDEMSDAQGSTGGLLMSFGRLKKLMLAGNQIGSIVPVLHPHNLAKFRVASGKWRTAFLKFLNDEHTKNGINSQDDERRNSQERLDQLYKDAEGMDPDGAKQGREGSASRINVAEMAKAVGAHVPPFCALESLELLRLTRNHIGSFDQPTSIERRDLDDPAGMPFDKSAEDQWSANAAITSLHHTEITDRTVIAAMRRLAWVSFAGNDAVDGSRLQSAVQEEHKIKEERALDERLENLPPDERPKSVAGPEGEAKMKEEYEQKAKEEYNAALQKDPNIKIDDSGKSNEPQEAISRAEVVTTSPMEIEELYKGLPDFGKYINCKESTEDRSIRVLGQGTSGVVKRCVMEIPQEAPEMDEGGITASDLHKYEEKMHEIAKTAGIPHLGSKSIYVAVKFFKKISSDGSAADEKRVLSALRQHPHLIAPLGSATFHFKDDEDMMRAFFPNLSPKQFVKGFDVDPENNTVSVVFPYVPAMKPLGMAPDINTVTDDQYPMSGSLAQNIPKRTREDIVAEIINGTYSSRPRFERPPTKKGKSGSNAVQLRFDVEEWVTSKDVIDFVNADGEVLETNTPAQEAIGRLLKDIPATSAVHHSKSLQQELRIALSEPMFDTLHPPTVEDAEAAKKLNLALVDLVDRKLYMRLLLTSKLLLDVADALSFLHHHTPDLILQHKVKKEVGKVQKQLDEANAQKEEAEDKASRGVNKDKLPPIRFNNPTYVSIMHGDLYAHNIFFSPPPVVHLAAAAAKASDVENVGAALSAAAGAKKSSAKSTNEFESSKYAKQKQKDIYQMAEHDNDKMFDGGNAAARLKHMLAYTPWQDHEGLLSDFGASFVYRDSPVPMTEGGQYEDNPSQAKRLHRPKAFEKTEVRAFGIFIHEMMEHIIGLDFVAIRPLRVIQPEKSLYKEYLEQVGVEVKKKKEEGSGDENNGEEQRQPAEGYHSMRELKKAVRLERVASAIDELRELALACSMVNREKRPTIKEVIAVLAGIVSLL